jgi:NTP pyrophosphatase (non-canonical NTP hydrolase)
MTTLTERIYLKLNTISPLSTDDFSTEWLGQSRSYHSSNKAQGYEASNTSLVKLMNRLISQHEVLMANNDNHQLLTKTANRYEALATEVGEEIADRSIKSNIANSSVKKILHRIIAKINSQSNQDHPPIIIC